MNNQLNKKDAQKWANALRSGKYKQTRSTLQNIYGYCCLGVACKIFIPKNKQRIHNTFLVGDLPENQKFSPYWLQNIDDDINNKLFYKFSIMNDTKDFTFDEIADIIELVYIHKVLD